eukprot:TRINITY_DN8253_c0_g1_i4.p1 TRINITY_DN8253_c0_g1~~TRINITY_DN8253_c0_g1_i4.p1  ORF type:complete len:280 (+),score=79.62 TRINITY_DN8253_c0_g1_i4:67-906(+)
MEMKEPESDTNDKAKTYIEVDFNTLKRAKYHRKLGKMKGNQLRSLASLRPGGGFVPLIDVIIERKSPFYEVLDPDQGCKHLKKISLENENYSSEFQAEDPKAKDDKKTFYFRIVVRDSINMFLQKEDTTQTTEIEFIVDRDPVAVYSALHVGGRYQLSGLRARYLQNLEIFMEFDWNTKAYRERFLVLKANYRTKIIPLQATQTRPKQVRFAKDLVSPLPVLNKSIANLHLFDEYVWKEAPYPTRISFDFIFLSLGFFDNKSLFGYLPSEVVTIVEVKS